MIAVLASPGSWVPVVIAVVVCGVLLFAVSLGWAAKFVDRRYGYSDDQTCPTPPPPVVCTGGFGCQSKVHTLGCDAAAYDAAIAKRKRR